MSTLPLIQSINQLMFNLMSKKVRTTTVEPKEKSVPNGVSSQPKHTLTVLAVIPELSLLFHPDKKTPRPHIRRNMSTSLLIQFINQLMFNFPEMDITTVATQNLSETNGDLSQLEHGSQDQVEIPELISQSHLDKLTPKPDKRSKNSILLLTPLMEFNTTELDNGLMDQEEILELTSQSHPDKLMPRLCKKLRNSDTPSTQSMVLADMLKDHGLKELEVIPDKLSLSHPDKKMPRLDIRLKLKLSKSTLLMDVNNLLSQLN